MPNGRTVLIAGEHEDYYDPDFFIYNDVVVLHPGGVCDIFGYPSEVFPPTDFHSATLVGNSVIMIGSLGYLPERKPGATQVLILDLESMGVRAMRTSGDSPGWIHNHEATLDEDGKSILICGGKTAEGGLTGRLTENVDYWRLRLADGHWRRMTRREWRRWRLSGGHSGRSVCWGIIEGARSDSGLGDSIAEMIENMAPDLGRPPNFAIAKELFSPPVSHERALADGEGTGIYRIVVEGIVVRYAVEPGEVVLTIEGSLPSATESLLLADLREKLQRLWEAPFEVEEL